MQSYTLENGLNTNFIHDVTQDKKGRMWFATEYGVSVYDGTFGKITLLKKVYPALNIF